MVSLKDRVGYLDNALKQRAEAPKQPLKGALGPFCWCSYKVVIRKRLACSGLSVQTSLSFVPFLSTRQKNVSLSHFQQLLILACGACMAVRSQVGLILNRRVCGSPVGCLLYHFWSQQRSCDWRMNSISLLRACRPLPNPCVDLLIASDNPMRA